MTELRSLKAEADIIAQGVPEKPEGYKFSLDGIEVPEGLKLNLKDDDPLLVQARAWAHENSVTQEGFAALVKLEAQRQIDQVKRFDAEVAKEREKLGANGQQRVDAVATALKGRIGDKAKPIIMGLVTAEQIESFEALLRTTQAAGPGAGAGGQGAKPDYTKMGPLERIAYAHEQHEKNRKAA
jgi:hypothetical protein